MGKFSSRGTEIAFLFVATTVTLAVLRIGEQFSHATMPLPVALAQPNPIGQLARTINFRVVAQSNGKPLPGVRLTVIVETTATLARTTDETGAITFDEPAPRPKFMQVDAQKDGFTPVSVWISHPNWEEEFPATYTLTMARAGPIGGVVKDEEGRPVAGATVSPVFSVTAGQSRSRQSFRLGDAPVTDAAGRWTLANMPSGYDPARLDLRIRHPDFEPFAVHGGKVADAIGPKGTVILRRGIEVVGQVVDPQGQPVHGARVSLGPTSFDPNRPVVETDHDGRFRLEHLPPGETTLTVQAIGHAPDLIKVDARQGLAPIKLSLGTPRTVQGRVLDQQGKPIARALVTVDQWRGFRTLELKAETGADGRFQWKDAPPDSVWISAVRDGFVSLRNREVPASEAETILKMARALTIAGTVVDSRTGQPIESFTLVPGFDRQDGTIVIWNRGESRRRNRGRYEIRFTEPAEEGHRLRIEAEGYAPGISRLIADREGDVRLDFVLVASKPITGVVRLREGRPVDGADVVLVPRSNVALIKNGKPPTDGYHRVVRTGPDGRYSFPPEPPPFSLVALHDRGLALVEVSEPAREGELVIKPWGRIDGTVRLGSRTGAGVPLVLFAGPSVDPGRALPGFSYFATADPAGRFVFERVVPGLARVTRKVAPGTGSPSEARLIEIEVKPDVTTHIDLADIPLVPTRPRRVLKVPEVAPGFRVETLEGQTLDLADYRGKYVLLEFWATWCGFCVDETPHLKATFDALGADKRFVMIGLSLDQAKDAPKNYVKASGVRWTQGFLGEWSKTGIPEAYGVTGIPAILLIGPDGRIVATDLRGTAIKKAVARALDQD